MSDMQMGTRGLSSGDLTRLRRLRGAGNDFSANRLNILVTNRDVNPTPINQSIYPPNFNSPRHMGSSRIRRTASTFTDFKGFMYGDSVSQRRAVALDGSTLNGKFLNATRLCNCLLQTGAGYIDPKKQGLCPKCSK